MTDPVGESRQVGHFFNAIRHHDGCRLVHLAKWDIGQFREEGGGGGGGGGGAFVTDAVWCIDSFDISFSSQFRWILFDESYSFSSFIFHSVFNYHISYSFFILSFQRYTQSTELYHILIHS